MPWGSRVLADWRRRRTWRDCGRAIQCAHQTLTNRLIALLGPVVGCRSGGVAGGGLLLAGLLAAIAETARRPGHFTEAASGHCCTFGACGDAGCVRDCDSAGRRGLETSCSCLLPWAFSGTGLHLDARERPTRKAPSLVPAASDEPTLGLDYSSERGSDETDDEMGVGGPLAAASTASAGSL